MRKKTTKELENEYNEKFPNDPIDFSKAEYKGKHIPIKIRCIKHNIWYEKTPDSLLVNGNICPECKKESNELIRQKNFNNGKESFREVLEQHYSDWEYDIDTYEGCNKKFKLVNKSTGEIIYRLPYDIKYKIKQATIGESVDKQTELCNLIENYDANIDTSFIEYTKYNKPVTLYCKIHKEKFQMSPVTIRARIKENKILCPSCEYDDYTIKYTEWYKDEYKKLHPNNTHFDLSKVIVHELRDHITIHCNIHDIDFVVNACKFLKNDSPACPECCLEAYKETLRKKNEADFLEYMKEHYPEFDTSKTHYIDNNTDLLIFCPHHKDQEIWVTP